MSATQLLITQLLNMNNQAQNCPCRPDNECITDCVHMVVSPGGLNERIKQSMHNQDLVLKEEEKALISLVGVTYDVKGLYPINPNECVPYCGQLDWTVENQMEARKELQKAEEIKAEEITAQCGVKKSCCSICPDVIRARQQQQQNQKPNDPYAMLKLQVPVDYKLCPICAPPGQAGGANPDKEDGSIELAEKDAEEVLNDKPNKPNKP